MFLLDTNVVSDPVGRSPSEGLRDWLAVQNPRDHYLSAISASEIEFGISRLGETRRRVFLEAWWAELQSAFENRILPVDMDVALANGRLRAKAQLAKRTMDMTDSYIAATAEVHGLTLVTRNVRHFEIWGGRVLDPWTGA